MRAHAYPLGPAVGGPPASPLLLFGPKIILNVWLQLSTPRSSRLLTSHNRQATLQTPLAEPAPFPFHLARPSRALPPFLFTVGLQTMCEMLPMSLSRYSF